MAITLLSACGSGQNREAGQVATEGEAVATCGSAALAPPTVFSARFNESPLRIAPGDLLVLPGDGFAATDQVYYESAVGPSWPVVPPPCNLPASNTALSGGLSVVSTVDVPHSLVVRAPAQLSGDFTYAVWVRHLGGTWGAPIFVNDARPGWVSPNEVYSSATWPGLPRQIKVVGRNLEPGVLAVTTVKLFGPATYILTAKNDGSPATAIERYAAVVDLPNTLVAGTYNIAVSRDGISWVNAPATAQLTVLRDPSAPRQFPITNYFHGNLPTTLGSTATGAPAMGVDFGPAILAAITAAHAAGGGDVYFPPGEWDILDPNILAGTDGIQIPAGVNLVGAGADVTRIVVGPNWYSGTHAIDGSVDPNPTVFSLFALTSNSVVRNLHVDAPGGIPTCGGSVSLKACQAWEYTLLSFAATSQALPAPDGLTIANCALTGMQTAINDLRYWNTATAVPGTYKPASHVFIVNNTVESTNVGLWLGGLDDSVISNNTFHPGLNSGQPMPAELTGLEAAEMGGMRRLDFSGNLVDARNGWNGGFDTGLFMDLAAGSNEQVLLSENQGHCTGQRGGSNGEFLVGDSNGDDIIFSMPVSASSATASSVTVPSTGALAPPATWAQHRIFVMAGKGRGQTRKVESATLGDAGVTVVVSPAWDVAPDSTSQIYINRSYWQTLYVDNRYDDTGCTNGHAHPNGALAPFGNHGDSVVEGNTSIGGAGIVVFGTFSEPGATDYALSFPRSSLQYFTEVTGNTQPGATIVIGAAAAPSTGLVETLGVSFGHNTLSTSTSATSYFSADLLIGYDWAIQTMPLAMVSTTVFSNHFSYNPNVPAVLIDTPEAVGTVLAGNVFDSTVGTNIVDGGTMTVLLP